MNLCTETTPAPSCAPARRSGRGRTVGFATFVAAVTVIFCAAVTTVEFSSVPVAGLRSVLILIPQVGAVVAATGAVVALLALNRVLFAALFPLFALIGAVVANYMLSIGVGLTPVSIEIALVNDAAMWLTVVTPSLLGWLAGAAAFAAAASFVRWRMVREPGRRRGALIAVGALALLILPPALSARVSGAVSARLPYAIYFATRDYLSNRKAVASERSNFATLDVEPPAVQPDIIFVLGESLRADHLPFNGYERMTMPRMSADTALVSLSHIRSHATHTYASVPHILTGCDSTMADSAFASQSVITLFRRGGYRTAWFANQDLASSYAYFAHEADTLIWGNAARSVYTYGKWLDTDLLPSLGEWLASPAGKPSMAVVHTIGSHWWYKSHYPDSARNFMPDTPTKEISTLSREQIVNAYDNTILATDDFLARLTALLRDRCAIVVYISDHGESLGEGGVWLHATESEPLHYPACMIWFSDAYRRAYPGKVEALRRRSAQPAATDAIFHTLLDGAGLRTSALDRSRSFFNRSDE